MTHTTAQLARGLRRHQAGQFDQAERAYREVLADDPENSDALHLLGLVSESLGNLEAASTLMARAIGIRGPAPQYCASLGRVLRSQGKAAQAQICFRQAADLLALSLAAHPEQTGGWRLLGSVFQALNCPGDALRALRQATALESNSPEAHYDLGVLLAGADRLPEAEQSYRRALRVRPDFPEALNNLGNVLRRMGRAADAVPRYRSALRKRPDFVEAHYNLGLALQSLDRLQDAEAAYREALRRQPSLAAAHNNLANTLQALGDPHRAMPHYEQAVQFEPANLEFRVNLGMAQLLTGDFASGWANYAARTGASPDPALWDGSPLDGESVLLRAEQGFGDTIQFIRYARMVKQRGGWVVFASPAPLLRLMHTAQGIDTLLAEGEDSPVCRYWAPLLHLPGVFQTSPDTIPIRTPYLRPDPALAEEWAASLAIAPAQVKVGLAWRGSPQHHNDRNRSIEPAELAALGGLDHVTFVSLQPGHSGGCTASGLAFAPLPRELTDFADTSALVDRLDLVISVDTAVAHLAGAMARPVWTLLPFAPDWRWMLDRADSPWYPTMRLFRQHRHRDWRGVLQEVRGELEKLRHVENSTDR